MTGIDTPTDDDLGAAAHLFGWALTLWTIGVTIIAGFGHARAEWILTDAGVPGAHWIVFGMLFVLASVLTYARVRKSRWLVVVGSFYGALFCVMDAILVIPVLLKQNAGLEIANWGLNFLLFMLSAVVNSRSSSAKR